jgi:hypothetical protein
MEVRSQSVTGCTRPIPTNPNCPFLSQIGHERGIALAAKALLGTIGCTALLIYLAARAIEARYLRAFLCPSVSSEGHGR